MIVGKRMVKMKILRFISLLTLVFLMLPLCFSCGKDDALDDIFEKMTFYTNDVSLGETAFTEHIYVVIPKECSGELSLKARELVDKLKEQTGIIVTLKYDNEFNSNPKSSCEILVGGTDRLASKNALDVLKNDEYLCRWDNGAIVICGRSEQATVDALSRFITDILPTSSKY